MKQKKSDLAMGLAAVLLMIGYLSVPAPSQPSSSTEEKEEELLWEEEREELPSSQYQVLSTTYYNPVPSQCSGDPLVTASCRTINLRELKKRKLKWIAISRDLLPEYPFGTKVYVETKGHPELSGVYEVQDLLGEFAGRERRKIKYQIDILSHPDHGDIIPEGRVLSKVWKI